LVTMPANAEYTSVQIPVPEAEALLRRVRKILAIGDTLADVSDEVTLAHVSIVAPFMPIDRLTASVVDGIRSLCASVPSFSFRLDGVAGFPGGILYLPPAPELPFAGLTERFVAAWPDYLPYGGIVEGVIPHVSVAYGIDGDMQVAPVCRVVGTATPIDAVAREVQIVLYSPPASPQLLHRFPFK
jgi:hypothetical protein